MIWAVTPRSFYRACADRIVSHRRRSPAAHQPDQDEHAEGQEPSAPDLVVVAAVAVADEFQEGLRGGHPAERQQLQGRQLGREDPCGSRHGHKERRVQAGNQLSARRERMQRAERQLHKARQELVPGSVRIKQAHRTRQ